MVATQLMWVSYTTACALRTASEYSFTDLGRVDSEVGCWFVVCNYCNGIRAHADRPYRTRNTVL